MSAIDNAVARLQVHALACTGVKGAPTYPVEDAGVLPLSIAYVQSGEFSADDAGTNRGLYTLNVDFHFARITMKDAYTRINRLVPEFKGYLCSDPKLNNTVDTIIFPVTFEIIPTQWDSVQTQMVKFVIPVKVREATT